jgi:hypothetical protein
MVVLLLFALSFLSGIFGLGWRYCHPAALGFSIRVEARDHAMGAVAERRHRDCAALTFARKENGGFFVAIRFC